MSNVVAFLPVIHAGVVDFLKQSKASRIYLLAFDDVEGYDHLGREVRTLSCADAKSLLNSLGYEVLTFKDSLEKLVQSDEKIFMPDEDISHAVSKKYFSHKEVVFSPTFLRWDWSKTTIPSMNLPEADRIIKFQDTEGEEIRRYLEQAGEESQKSSDWWRQVGAMAIPTNGTPLLSFNKHMPNEYVPYIDGDPRQNFKPGEYNDIYTSLHAEKGIVSHAAKKGISLNGADLYVSTFPCNDCANIIVETGIRRIYFTGGYSNLNGVKTLRDHGVELVYVEL